jgi:hypothetical protein
MADIELTPSAMSWIGSHWPTFEEESWNGWAKEDARHFVGTRRFSSSNQFSTTTMLVGEVS